MSGASSCTEFRMIAIKLSRQLQQLGNIHRDPPRLVVRAEIINASAF
jgi:hypothetical protein